MSKKEFLKILRRVGYKEGLDNYGYPNYSYIVPLVDLKGNILLSIDIVRGSFVICQGVITIEPLIAGRLEVDFTNRMFVEKFLVGAKLLGHFAGGFRKIPKYLSKDNREFIIRDTFVLGTGVTPCVIYMDEVKEELPPFVLLGSDG